MKNIILGFLLGIFTSLLILNQFNWEVIFSPEIFKVFFATFLALLAGLIALYQVKANVISSARIKWIEEFKTNVCEYIGTLNEAMFAISIYSKGSPNEMEYYNKYFVAINRSHVHENKIRLNLNLKEDAYKLIDIDLDEIKDILLDKGIGKLDENDEQQILLKFHSLAEHTNSVLKSEWDKSKKMFYSRWWEKLNKQ